MFYVSDAHGWGLGALATWADALVYEGRVQISLNSYLASPDTGRRQVQKARHGGIPRVHTHRWVYAEKPEWVCHPAGLCFSAISSQNPLLSPRTLSPPVTCSDCNCSLHECDGLINGLSPEK